MKRLVEQKFIGERALFQSSEVDIVFCTFEDGESPLKESRHINIRNSNFKWKYPLWYSNQITINDSVLHETARAGIWYTHNVKVANTVIEAPKTFRRCETLELENVSMPNAAETFWNCDHIILKDINAKGDYFAMNSSNIAIEGFELVGNYAFDGVKNLTIKNAKMLTKDAFWNCDNVTVYDSYISGEYLGWNSKNVTLINCTIESTQGMCYMENVVMRNCRLINTDLSFEYSTVDAEIIGNIQSVKNPYSGRIVADSIENVIFDNLEMKKENTSIKIREKKRLLQFSSR